MKIAIIGGGAAGLTASYYLNKTHDITLFEKSNRLGGHAHTHIISKGPDKNTPLDIGFMVLNNKNYPTMHKLLAELGINQIAETEMSFSHWNLSNDFHYALNFDIENIFTKSNLKVSSSTSQKNLFSLLRPILSFMELLKKDLKKGTLVGKSISDYVKENKTITNTLYYNYILPMASGIWSTPPNVMKFYPIEALAKFYDNHGLINIQKPPKWQYIKGGSQLYVQKIAQTIGVKNIQLNTEIKSVKRISNQIIITFINDVEASFDKVFFATHADTTLSLLGDLTNEEKSNLSAWNYENNLCVLHSDQSLMPPKSSWASWNYMAISNELSKHSNFCMTYHLNRLQGHFNTKKQYFLTVNPTLEIPQEFIHFKINMRHPQYSLQSFSAQKRLQTINGKNNTFFCGSYLGNGFHEDAIKSGFEAVNKLNDNRS